MKEGRKTGTWPSAITPSLLTAGTLRLSSLQAREGAVAWVEGRPEEGGRCVVCEFPVNARGEPCGEMREVVPAGMNARTRVHEYGGGAYVMDDKVCVFVNFTDQRVYKVSADEPVPQPVTPEGTPYRYADLVLDHAHNQVICVREDHSDPRPSHVKNTLVGVSLVDGTEHTISSAHDFVAAPALHPTSASLAFIAWDHPHMPWDSTHLYIAALNEKGHATNTQRVPTPASPSPALQQPRWAPNGTLYFVSDETGYWNLHRFDGSACHVVEKRDTEFGSPLWTFGTQKFAITPSGVLWCVFAEHGRSQLASLDTNHPSPSLQVHASPSLPPSIGEVVCVSESVLAIVGGSASDPLAVLTVHTSSLSCHPLRHAAPKLPEGYVSVPSPIEFPTRLPPLENNDKFDATAHAMLYLPQNAKYTALEGDLPPLLVKCHGGPTSSCSTVLRTDIQFWTSRGYAVVDVDYGGSAGYGRAYRNRLNSQWGVVDVEDCCNVVRYLVDAGKVDPNRVCIDGGSAGGYTTLACLAFRDVFKAGCSLYGVSDLEALAADTHKFESRYLDGLIGEYPKDKAVYVERSPIHHLSTFSCPILLLQGSEDKIVPPDQSQRMHEAVKAKGIPTAYVLYDGEQHGFRVAANMQHAVCAELEFYSRVFGEACPESDRVGLDIVNLK